MDYVLVGEAVIGVLVLVQIILFITSKKDNKQDGATLTALKTHLERQDDSMQKMTKDLLETKADIAEKISDGFHFVSKEGLSNQMEVMKSLQAGIDKMQETTEKRLSVIQGEIKEKLDTSLNERLDKSFEQITTQLSSLYKSLGELENMSDGIVLLNKTLSNVKTRGTWGEVQLGNLIEDTMQIGQYEKNVKLKKNSDDLVEYAIKIPSKEDDNTFIYLPIDAKFPTDRYIGVIEASQSGNKEALNKATRELEQRIKEEARTIRDKYIAPPVTTDFAIMFLPTESMYAEVIRIDGLMEYCQNQYRIVIASPSTITALLNSLHLGFANIALNKKTAEVRKILQAVKTQYGKLTELIDATQKKLDAAVSSTDKLKDRAEKIQKSMSKIDMLDSVEEANMLLELNDEE